MERGVFDRIKERQSGYASWAVWADAEARPKSNVGDLTVLDPDVHPHLLDLLKPDVVMLGLNASGAMALADFEPWHNFHSPNPRAHDFKIRFAFRGTKYYGAYMTDFIKDVEILTSSQLMKHVKANPRVAKDNAEILLREFEDIGCPVPTILAFGAATYKLVNATLGPDDYVELIKLPHYSRWISKENYRAAVWEKLHIVGTGAAERSP